MTRLETQLAGHLAACLRYIEHQAAHEGKCLNEGQLAAELAHLKTVAVLEIGQLCGYQSRVNLAAIRAVLAEVRALMDRDAASGLRLGK